MFVNEICLPVKIKRTINTLQVEVLGVCLSLPSDNHSETHMRFPLTFPNEEMRNAIVLLHFHGYLSTNVTSETKHGSLRRRCAMSIKIFSPQAEFSQKIFTAINSGRPLISLTSTRQAKIGNGGTHRERILIRISSQ